MIACPTSPVNWNRDELEQEGVLRTTSALSGGIRTICAPLTQPRCTTSLSLSQLTASRLGFALFVRPKATTARVTPQPPDSRFGGRGSNHDTGAPWTGVVAKSRECFPLGECARRCQVRVCWSLCVRSSRLASEAQGVCGSDAAQYLTAARPLTDHLQCLQLLFLTVIAHLKVVRPIRIAFPANRLFIARRHGSCVEISQGTLLGLLAVRLHLEICRPVRLAFVSDRLRIAQGCACRISGTERPVIGGKPGPHNVVVDIDGPNCGDELSTECEIDARFTRGPIGHRGLGLRLDDNEIPVGRRPVVVDVN